MYVRKLLVFCRIETDDSIPIYFVEKINITCCINFEIYIQIYCDIFFAKQYAYIQIKKKNPYY